MDRRLISGRGYSLLELMVALALAAVLMGGLLKLFQVQSEVVRRQSLAADLQQSLRVARHELVRVTRMAGRGGLPRGAAVLIRNNIGAGERLADARTPVVVTGTDVLVVRGVFASPALEVASSETSSESGTLTLRRNGLAGQVQELEPMLEVARAAGGEALLLSGGPGSEECAVAELVDAVEGDRDRTGELTELTLTYRVGGSTTADDYRSLAEGCRTGAPGWVRRAGLLEEYRFYLRRDDGSPGLGSNHQLARARFYPGSDRVHRSSPSGGVALVDHALDLQVSLAFDPDGDGSIIEGSGPGRSSDEWLFNAPGDRPEEETWSSGPPRLVRMTLLMRAARASRGYLSPPLDRIEDRPYDEADSPTARLESRLFQRRWTTFVVRPRG